MLKNIYFFKLLCCYNIYLPREQRGQPCDVTECRHLGRVDARQLRHSAGPRQWSDRLHVPQYQLATESPGSRITLPTRIPRPRQLRVGVGDVVMRRGE